MSVTRSAPIASLLDNVNGLPSHALLVHFTVVISTVGALVGLAYVLVPRFRAGLSLPLGFVGIASVLLGLLTPATGERLEGRLPEEPLIEQHAELGDQMGIIMIAFGTLLILTVLVVRFRNGRVDSTATAPTALERLGGIPGRRLDAFSTQALIASILTVLVFAGSIVSGIWIVRTGEAGAKSVWHDVPTTAVGGEHDDDER